MFNFKKLFIVGVGMFIASQSYANSETIQEISTNPLIQPETMLNCRNYGDRCELDAACCSNNCYYTPYVGYGTCK